MEQRKLTKPMMGALRLMAPRSAYAAVDLRVPPATMQGLMARSLVEISGWMARKGEDVPLYRMTATGEARRAGLLCGQ